jgi:hypothetical protein
MLAVAERKVETILVWQWQHTAAGKNHQYQLGMEGFRAYSFTNILFESELLSKTTSIHTGASVLLTVRS